jgi:molecular chaperone GrpE (heat shock protein)
MDEPTLADVAERLDELGRELRRQGRAAVAAQAAAESCLEALTADPGSANGHPDDLDTDAAWVRAIAPVADALDRILAQSTALAERPVPERSRRIFSFGRTEERPDPEARALLQGLRVLRSQLLAALAGRGVAVDHETGVAVDPELHRVVEVRGARQGVETVIEIVRPGYRVGGRVVRETEVVVRRG